MDPIILNCPSPLVGGGGVPPAPAWLYGPAHDQASWDGYAYGTIVYEANGIKINASSGVVLEDIALFSGIEYELRFDALELVGTYGLDVVVGRAPDGIGTYSLATQTAYPDHTVSQYIGTSYLMSNGVYHKRFTLPATLAEYRLRIIKATHPTSHKFANLAIRAYVP